WRALTDAQRRWVVEGGDDWTGKWQTQWYGIRRFFDWLESKAYKMHIRVLLSKYRSYTPCTSCRGARLKPDALLWRVGSLAEADAALSRAFGSREAGRVGEGGLGSPGGRGAGGPRDSAAPPARARLSSFG